MQKHPMLSVKEAAEALKLDERSVRERLINGTLKGEKQTVGLREKWFVYRGAIDSALSKQSTFTFTPMESSSVSTASTANAAFQTQRTSLPTEEESSAMVHHAQDNSSAHLETSYITDAIVTEVPEKRVDVSDASRGEWHGQNKETLESIVATIMQPLVDKVAAQEREIATKLSLLRDQEKTIEDQKRQLRLLPDLEKERKELELKELEMQALQKQLAAVAAEKAKALESKELEVVALLKRAEEERVAADEVKKLAEDRADEIQGLTQHIAAVEEEKHVLSLKAAEASKLADDLVEIKRTVEKLQTPWWRKLLGH